MLFWLSPLVLLTSLALPSQINAQWQRVLELLAQALANKVNRAHHRPAQLRLAGWLAAFCLIAPLVLGLALFNWLNPLHALSDALLLCLLLQWRGPMACARHIENQLSQWSHSSVSLRLSLNRYVLRDTQALSQAGMGKTVIEMLTLRLANGWFAPVFWFCLVGIEASFCYVLLSQLHFSWNSKLASFKHFGAPMQRLYALSSALPYTLVRWLIAGFKTPSHGTNASHRLLSGLAQHLKVELGGPRYYQGARHECIRIGQRASYPQALHIRHLRNRLRGCAILFLLLLLPLYALRHVL